MFVQADPNASPASVAAAAAAPTQNSTTAPQMDSSIRIGIGHGHAHRPHYRPNHHHHHNQHHDDFRIPAIEKYAYCLCLHVKPATIFIALIKLVKTFVFASIILNSEFTIQEQMSEFKQRSTAAAVGIAMLVIVGSVSSLAIYAVISGRAALLMPLYAVMLCDFFFTLPTTYNRDLNEPSIVDPNFRELVTLNQNSRYAAIVLSTFDMLIKIYFLCIIWKCYRYLRLRELILPLRFAAGLYPHIHQARLGDGHHHHHHLPGMARATPINPADVAGSENVAPPSYDAIVTSIKSQPPNYDEAMNQSSIIKMT